MPPDGLKKFKRIGSNRHLIPTHVRRLAKDIQSRNLLHLFPIIVNSNLEIIEGQHRHAAAMEIQVPLYYIVDDKIKRSDIAAINSNRKSWTGKDYVRHYAEEGNKGFKKLQGLLEQFPKLSIMAGARLMDKKSDSYFLGGTSLSDIRMGKIDDSSYPTALAILSWAQGFSKMRPYAFFPNFLLAVKNACMEGSSDRDYTLSLITKRVHGLPLEIDKMDGMVRPLKQLLNR